MTADHDIPILLVGDHSVLATSLAMALRGSGFAAVTTVEADDITAESVLDVARSVHAGIALLDVRAGNGRLGLAMVGPLVSLGAKVLLFSATDNPYVVSAGLQAGAEAIVDRAMSFERLVATLVALAQGRELMPSEERAALLEVLQQRDGVADDRRRPFDALTGREAHVLRCLIDGSAPKQIAYSEGLSISTVRGHIERIFAKLDVNSQREALALARAVGWPDAVEAARTSGQFSP